jgi:hypothetical protein
MTQNFNTALHSLISEQSDENKFNTQVFVEINDYDFRSRNPDKDPDTSSKAKIEYSIDIDYRSWGIKGIDVSILSVDDFTIEYIDYSLGDDKEKYELLKVKTSSMDCSKINKELNIGKFGQIFPQKLELHVDEHYVPVPEKSTIYFG